MSLITACFAMAQNPGDIIISEIMIDPDGNEREREWFEVYNTTNANIDMNGWTIFDESSSSRAHVITSATPVIVPANSYATLVSNDDTALNGGMTVAANNIIYEYSYNSPVGGPPTPGSGTSYPTWNNESTYANGSTNDDGIRLETASGTVIDQILYGFGYAGLNDWPAMGAPTFTSYQLDANTLDAASNDLSANWLQSTATYGSDGAVGTPGTANFAGGGMPVAGPGDIVITELMIDPDGTEAEREWFEVLNTTSNPIDLQNWVIGDISSGASKSHLINTSVVVPAGGYAVLAASDDPNLNGGITNVAYGYGFVSQDPNTSSTANGFLRMNNESSFDDSDTTDNETDGPILVSDTGVEIDRVAYDYGYGTAPIGFPAMGAPGGASIESNTTDYIANDLSSAWNVATAAFGTAGQFGTPGLRNTLSTGSFSLGEVRLYPNPASNAISLELEDGQWEALEIFNITGQKVLEVNQYQDRVDISPLNSGAYFLRVTAEKAAATLKLLVK